ncbi:glycine cleavage system protein R [Halioxenophilus sp. WMMB6]|uniref:glycine cleavage system protein R n=1 Tax=Halioxenophilus sp. WMMB6 TaxID=3073815 RepID=UPI00295EF213|nr:ACT domain-containing protein [Halioxenophilus sp. WMMB6]
MIAHLILTVIADDRPGVVEQLAEVIANHNGNWLESQLAHLHGKFAGIVAIAITEQNLAPLQQALTQLGDKGFSVATQLSSPQTTSQFEATFELTIVGPDRSGIIKEVSGALARRGINLLELSSECSSMPWSGEPMFTARGKAQMPDNINLAELDEALDLIAEELGLDIALEDRQEA